jgi:ubiquinone/menaquinone biosynthesis C-methylase UbiE
MVGPTGRVIGVDMTPAMLDKARANAEVLGLTNAEFREGYLEALPVTDASVDLVISNGVVNLCPDKASVLAEAYRVLEPGGRLQLSDIVVASAVPEDAKADISLWTG